MDYRNSIGDESSITCGILSKPLLEKLQVKADYLNETNISALSLSVRSSNGLRRNGIGTIYKLIHCSEGGT